MHGPTNQVKNCNATAEPYRGGDMMYATPLEV